VRSDASTGQRRLMTTLHATQGSRCQRA
jgi:hypothetical protein